jgi:hypothetical protein
MNSGVMMLIAFSGTLAPNSADIVHSAKKSNSVATFVPDNYSGRCSMKIACYFFRTQILWEV